MQLWVCVEAMQFFIRFVTASQQSKFWRVPVQYKYFRLIIQSIYIVDFIVKIIKINLKRGPKYFDYTSSIIHFWTIKKPSSNQYIWKFQNFSSLVQSPNMVIIVITILFTMMKKIIILSYLYIMPSNHVFVF